jgi:hypothetical protein
MSTASMDSMSSESDLEYTGSDLSSGIISVGELCVAEKKQIVLRDVSFHLKSAQKVDSWLDKLCMGRILSMAPDVQKKEMDECISVSGVVGQRLPLSPDERGEDDSFSQQLNCIVTKTNDAPLAFADRRDCRDKGKPAITQQDANLTCSSKYSGRPNKVEVLPAVQLDPHSALREARRLMTVHQNNVPPRHAKPATPHVWARRLALALEGDPPGEALARFAALTKDERHLVTRGIFELRKGESGGESRDTWEPTVPDALWPADVFAGAARVLDVQLRDYVEVRAYEKRGDIEEEADITEEAWPSADDALAGVHWNRVPSDCPKAQSPFDTTKSARVEDDSPQSTPKHAVSIPRVEFRIETESFSGPCQRDHSPVPTIWLCLGTRHIEDQGSKGEKPTHGYRVVKPISVQEKLMLADAVMLLGAEPISKWPELYLI